MVHETAHQISDGYKSRPPSLTGLARNCDCSPSALLPPLQKAGPETASLLFCHSSRLTNPFGSKVVKIRATDQLIGSPPEASAEYRSFCAAAEFHLLICLGRCNMGSERSMFAAGRRGCGKDEWKEGPRDKWRKKARKGRSP